MLYAGVERPEETLAVQAGPATPGPTLSIHLSLMSGGLAHGSLLFNIAMEVTLPLGCTWDFPPKQGT